MSETLTEARAKCFKDPARQASPITAANIGRHIICLVKADYHQFFIPCVCVLRKIHASGRVTVQMWEGGKGEVRTVSATAVFATPSDVELDTKHGL